MGLKETIKFAKEHQPNDKILDLNNPENTIIEVRVSTNMRQCGRIRLTHEIAQALANVGYQNVEVKSMQDHDSVMQSEKPLALTEEDKEILNRVTIHVIDNEIPKERIQTSKVTKEKETL